VASAVSAAGAGVNILYNEFCNIREGSCSDCHTDAIQLLGAADSVIRGNYIHDVSTGIVAYDGVSGALIVLLVYGHWQDTTASAAGLRRVQVGVTDFFYKAAQGYEGYSHAQDEGLFQCGADLDCPLNEAFWTQLIAPAHGL